MKKLFLTIFLSLTACDTGFLRYVGSSTVLSPKYKIGDCYVYDYSHGDVREPWEKENLQFSRVLQIGHKKYRTAHVYRDDGRYWGLGTGTDSIPFIDSESTKVNCPAELTGN